MCDKKSKNNSKHRNESLKYHLTKCMYLKDPKSLHTLFEVKLFSSTQEMCNRIVPTETYK